MKESSDKNNVLDYNKYKYVIDNENIEKNKVYNYNQILLSKPTVTVVFNNRDSSTIQINNNISFGRIIGLAQIYPVEFTFFEVNKEESMSISKSQDSRSINKIKNESSQNNNLYISNKSNNEYYLEQKKSLNNNNNYKLTKLEIFFYYYMKLLYFFYLIAGIIIFIQLMLLFFNTKYKFKSVYFWVTLVLVIAILCLGYIGITKFYGVKKNENIHGDENYDQDDIFWFNFILLVLTMTSFIFLIKEHYLEVKGEKIVGLIFISFYLIVLLIEIFALLYFDLTNRIFELKLNDGYMLLDSNEENERLIEI